MRKILIILSVIIFPLVSVIGQNNINRYEYWFDNNYAGKTEVGITTPIPAFNLNTSIPATGINSGLHTFHIRFRDDNNHYSSTVSQFFQKLPSSTSGTKQIVEYEYWFDNNYADKTLQAITPQSTYLLTSALQASTLSQGFHTMHIRFKDDGGGWSNVFSQFFQKVSSSASVTKQIVAYEYWFDNDYSGKVYQAVTAQSTIQLLNNLDASAINAGLHIFHIRFKDDGGAWSTVSSQFFQKVSGGTSVSNEINAYEYWFDNNYAGKVLQSVTAQSELQLLTLINAASLTNGLHVFHVRFRDIGNSWSSVNSSFFQKFEQNATVTNYITEYRYWFDSADSIMFNEQLPSPTNLFLLNTPLDLSGIHKGDHIIHFQFLDTLKNWSCVTSDSMYKFPTVIADFTPDKWILCDSGSVSFANNSFDADSINWIFDDGSSSNIGNPSHYFNTYGTHPITLIAYDTTKGVKDTLVLDISVVHSPVANLGNDTTVCPPGISINAWNSNCTYLWSNSSTDSLIHVNSPNTYSVIITNQWGCSSKDTVHINFNPAPSVNLGNDTTICVGNTIVLNAGSGFTYYNWCNGETSQTITVSANGIYCVEVTNQYGCHKTDSIHILTDPCTGIKDINGNDFVSIYPNPNSGIYFIKALADFSEPIEIRVTDLSGRLLYRSDNNLITKDEVIPIDNVNFDNGIYMLYLTSRSARIIKKIVINH